MVGLRAECPGSCPSARGNPAKGCAGDVTIETNELKEFMARLSH